jgi:hypothetical protein
MKGFLTGSAVVIAAAAVAILGFEVLLRAIGYSAPTWHQPDERLGWILRPGVGGWFKKEGRAFVQVNATGARDQDHRLHKPAGVYRIAVLGDSFAEAMQVGREQAFWALLPERLHACGFQPGKRIEVLNFGVSGYGTAQQYVMLESHAMRYSPDLVLLQFTNGNDVRDNHQMLSHEKARPFFMLERDGGVRLDESFASAPGFRQRQSTVFELARGLSDRLRVVQLVRDARHSAPPFITEAQAAGSERGLDLAVLAPPREPVWEEAWRITEGAIGRVHDYARRNRARFMVMTVPYAVQVDPDPKVRAALQAKLGVEDLFYPDNRIAALARKRGFAAVTVARVLQPVAEQTGIYFHGFENAVLGRGHWNTAGHSAAADLVALRLCNRG